MLYGNKMLKEINHWRKLSSSPIGIQTKDNLHIKNTFKRKSPIRHYVKSNAIVWLTPREKQVSDLILSGCESYKALAAQLNLSPRTIEYYIKAMRTKLGVANKKALKKTLSKIEFVKAG